MTIIIVQNFLYHYPHEDLASGKLLTITALIIARWTILRARLREGQWSIKQ